jgi:hypothetical protein
MIRQVSAPSLAFEQTVRDVLTAPLAAHGFAVAPEVQIYQNVLVSFMRFQQGQREMVRFGRLLYDVEELGKADKRDEADAPRHSEHYGELWPSRHLLYIECYVNNRGADLFPTGKIAYGRNGEDLWYFTDEANLARRLRDEALPMILDAGLKWFDVTLDDELDLIARDISTPYRPPDAA